MRRKDREVTDINEILGILLRCDTVRMGIHGDEFPYVVPLSFGARIENETVVVYFHCAKQGMKIDRLRENGNVCVEGDLFDKTEKTEHGITTRYESVIGFGKCALLEDPGEITKGLEAIIDHYGYSGYPLEQCTGMQHLLVGKVTLQTITGKRNLSAK